jgi:cobalt-precorrin-5B (C1)-methyltransferase
MLIKFNFTKRRFFNVEYVCDNGKILRCGYTTGACATGGAIASAKYLLTGDSPTTVEVVTPNGKVLSIPISKLESIPHGADCTIIKDGGDDIDVTNGIEIITHVELTNQGITIDYY